jgi:transcriptional regulator of aromatic amino acid metabolism
MTELNHSLYRYNTFFLSNEESHFPLIPEIIKFAKKIKNQVNDDINLSSTLSIVYGKRIVINAKDTVFDKLNIDDFIEVVDFDPVKNNLLVMGKKNPADHTPIQWFIHHAKKEVLITIILSEYDIEKFNFNLNSIPIVTKQNQLLEMVKKIMKLLQSNNCVYIKDTGLLITGKTLNEIEDNIQKLKKE